MGQWVTTNAIQIGPRPHTHLTYKRSKDGMITLQNVIEFEHDYFEIVRVRVQVRLLKKWM